VERDQTWIDECSQRSDGRNEVPRAPERAQKLGKRDSAGGAMLAGMNDQSVYEV